jgi:hypothetical protein
VERTALLCGSINQAASPASVFRVMLQNLPMTDGLHDLVQGDLLLNHLLLGVLR